VNHPEKSAILIVDDNLGNRIAFQSVLEVLGQTVVTVDNGRTALEETHFRDFAVILLDVRMADMDGLETAAELRKRENTRHTPILFVSAFEATPSLVADAHLVGAMDYLFSPVDPELLKLKVSAFVELHLEQQRRRRETSALEAENRELRRRIDKLRADNEDLRSQLDLCSP
jgi:response regulator RpfG family c-di-GMP phosphodiesterase